MSELVDAPSRADQGYNTVFEELVGDEDDLEGMVAYALYKRAKYEWIREHRPTQGEVQAYHRTVTASQQALYQNRALQMLMTFAQQSVREAEPEIKAAALSEAVLQEVRNANRECVDSVRRQSNWIRDLGVNVLGSIVFAALLILGGVLKFTPPVETVLGIGAKANPSLAEPKQK